MTQPNLRQLATEYLKGLHRAGVTDLPANSTEELGQWIPSAVEDDSSAAKLPVVASESGKAIAESIAESKGGYQSGPQDKPEPEANDEANDQPQAESVTGEKQTSQANAGQPESVDVATPYGASLDEAARVAGLQVLSQTVAACTKCPQLSSCRTQTVFGVGSARPRLVFFGEGPGADEDRMGEPFVGRAGELLNKIISACKMTRDEVYIFNTVKCRPPGNRNPEPVELQNCQEYWQAQLEILQPEFICCLGSVAARTLLDCKESVGRMRGKFHQYRSSQVVVTYHPAYLLRTPEAKAKTWDDMKMLMKAMGVDL